MTFQSEVGHFFEKLSIWREESHRDFSNIIQFHSTTINKGISDLVQEVNNLKDDLSMITRERNDLLETVHNPSNGLRQRNIESQIRQPSPEPEVIEANDTEGIGPRFEKNSETSKSGTEKGIQDDSTFNESADFDLDEKINVEVTNDEISEKNLAEEQTTESNISQQFESKTSSNDDYVCLECKFPFSTSENLKIHLKNLHPKLGIINHNGNQSGNKKFKCEKCPSTSDNPVNMKQHIKDVHENIKNYVCKESGYAASHKGKLKQHIEEMH